jgi:hypothetical protein
MAVNNVGSAPVMPKVRQGYRFGPELHGFNHTVQDGLLLG